ncbi:MAG: cystathionine gamma-synthase family protein [Conexivisphaerales archaeon]|nr:cystathionine gamma-synthase family protein [Conexivisphaerales archaeon]
MNDETEAIHGHDYHDEFGSRIPSIHLSAMFEQRGEANKSDRNVDLKYSREENPTVRYLEKVISKLEKAEDSLAFSSGMAAIASLYLNSLSSGDEAVVTCEAYGTTVKLLEYLSKFGVKAKIVLPSAEEIASAVTKDTKLVFVESMTNPTLKVIDLDHVKDSIKGKAEFVIDNTFLSPVLFKPIERGADAVIESLTKYISGHNDVIGGIIAGKKEKILQLWETRRMTGSILSPFNAYLTLRGLKTLYARIRIQQESSLKIAKYLLNNPKIEEVMYPCLESDPYYNLAKKYFNGCGGVISFKVKGGKEEAITVLKNLKLIIPSPSLGGTESIMTYPVLSASSSLNDDCKKKLGITENLLRLSVGLENPEDIISDLEEALSFI